MTKIAGSKLHMLLASEQEYKWAMKGSRTADSKGQSCIRVLRWSTRSCARVGALSNMRTLNHTHIYTSTEAMVESGNRFTLRRPRYSELNSSPKKEPTQVPPAAPYSHVLSAPIVVQNRKLYSRFARRNNESLVLHEKKRDQNREKRDDPYRQQDIFTFSASGPLRGRNFFLY